MLFCLLKSFLYMTLFSEKACKLIMNTDLVIRQHMVSHDIFSPSHVFYLIKWQNASYNQYFNSTIHLKCRLTQSFSFIRIFQLFSMVKNIINITFRLFLTKRNFHKISFLRNILRHHIKILIVISDVRNNDFFSNHFKYIFRITVFLYSENLKTFRRTILNFIKKFTLCLNLWTALYIKGQYKGIFYHEMHITYT